LRCGPSVKQFFGFDILVFNDSIEFAMEKCEVVPISSTRYNQLLENMWVMHRFKIIHGDITDTNFMFSPVHGKVVFIDFGLSKLIAEECGFKTYTSFRGTPNFVSEAMLNLLGPGNNWDFIDLYYNDLVCLQKMYSYQKVKLKFSETF
jgi:serine/threonine protein kinase